MLKPLCSMLLRVCLCMCVYAGITRTDEGITAALTSHVPRCLVALIDRGLDGDFKSVTKHRLRQEHI